jgi:hypothetical protein
MLPLRPVHLSIAIRNVSQVERRLVRRQTIGSLALHAYFAKLCLVMRSDFCPGGHQGTSVETSILANTTTLASIQTTREYSHSFSLWSWQAQSIALLCDCLSTCVRYVILILPFTSTITSHCCPPIFSLFCFSAFAASLDDFQLPA